MKKIVVLDTIGDCYEPYDRSYILDQVAGYCSRNPSILRNASMTTVRAQGYRNGKWEAHKKPVQCVAFEVAYLSDAVWDFLNSGIGSWAVKLEVLPDDQEMTIIYPSDFQ